MPCSLEPKISPETVALFKEKRRLTSGSIYRLELPSLMLKPSVAAYLSESNRIHCSQNVPVKILS